MTETVTTTLDDHKEAVIIVDNDVSPTPVSLTPSNNNQENNADIRPPIPIQSLIPSQFRISPSTTIVTANITSEKLIVSSTSSGILSVMSQVLQDPDGNPPVIIAVGAAAVTRSSNTELSLTQSTPSRDPTGSIAGLIEQQFDR